MGRHPVSIRAKITGVIMAHRAQKGGFFNAAASQGIAIAFPDTSPRGAGAPNEDDDWDFGTGAGFYVNATKSEYAKHYNMYDHVTQELPKVIASAGLPIVGLPS
jgi:S-formylglutathione hydrolase